jgi:hypothetical protein
MLVSSPRNHLFFPIDIDRNTPAVRPRVQYVWFAFGQHAQPTAQAAAFGLMKHA